MSSVRMCDKCGAIFSENEEGWSTFTGARKMKAGRSSEYQEAAQDACPSCSNVMFGEPVTPRVQLAPPSRAERAYAHDHAQDLSAHAPGVTGTDEFPL